MTPLSQYAAHWPEISALLDEALNLPPADHAAWIAGLAGERAAHREALTALLARRAEVETDDFLVDGPKLGNLVDVPGASLGEGAQIGAYRLISEIGRGGMGTVWLAERSDGMMKRRVALKLPRAVWGDAFAERLEREREILASLEHEHIARLYDAGVDAQGRPFLAMEFVEGEPIDAYCRAHGLSLRERVALLLQVMAAVAHAHTRLVVHRDLKPANILVTLSGDVRLLDFGIAKLLEGESTRETALTALGGRALTLDYASPEQVRGEPLGVASDVYSLGVLAYELLSGSKPYQLKRQSAAALEEAIASVDVRPASSAAPDAATRKALRGDLDAILNRALKKDVAQRYPTVEALAQDIERHLQQRPVLAQPDSPAYRAGKFLRRNVIPVGAGGAVALALVAGLSVALWQAREAQAQAARAEAEVGRQEAVRSLYLEAMSGLSARVAGDPTVLSDRRAVTKALRDTLRTMAPRYAKRPAEWHAVLDAVMVQLNFADDFEGSLAVGQEYLKSVKAHRAPASEVIMVHIALGRNLLKLNQAAESEAIRRAGLAWVPESRDARTDELRLYLMSDLGLMLSQLGRRSEALQILNQAEQAAARRSPTDPVRSELLSDLAAVHMGFDNAASLRFARQAVALEQTGSETPPVEAASRLATLGFALLANGEAAEAERVFARAHPLVARMFGPIHRDSLRVLGGWGLALARQGRDQEARALVAATRASLATQPPQSDAGPRRRLDLIDLENAYLQGDLTKAISSIGPPDGSLPPGLIVRDLTGPLASEVCALTLAGRGAEALRLANGLRLAWPQDARPTAASIRLDLMSATAQLAAGALSDARQTLAPLIDTLRQHASPANWSLRVAIEMSAVAAARSGDAQTAVRELATVDNTAVAPSAVDRAESLLRQAEVLAAAGRKLDAQAAGRAALANLRFQHPSSPRLRQAQWAAGLSSAN
jgi:serine/threonine-protein kinase